MQSAPQFQTANPTQQFDIQKYEQENAQYRQEIDNLVQKNQALANEFRAKTEQIQRDMEAKLALFIPILKNGGDLGANLQSSTEENNRLKAELAQRNQYIAQLENQNKASQQEIHRLNSVLAQNQDAFQRQRTQDQGIINQLQTQVVLLENNLRAEASEVVHLKNEVKSQKQKVSHCESEINDLRKKLRDANASAVSNKLHPDGTLHQGECLTSKNGNYKVIMQEDANLVLYDQFKKAIWSSDSYKTKIQGPYHLRMQADGNLVIYGRGNQPVWASDTYQKGAGSSCLVLQDKGKLVIKDRNESEQWSS